MQYSQITNRIYMGAVPESVGDSDLLLSLGITHVINCIESPANTLSLWSGPQCLCPQYDDSSPRDPEVLQRGINYYHSYPYGIFYVHCWVGKMRSAAMVLAILTSDGMDMAEALQLLRSKIPDALSDGRYISDVSKLL